MSITNWKVFIKDIFCKELSGKWTIKNLNDKNWNVKIILNNRINLSVWYLLNYTKI